MPGFILGEKIDQSQAFDAKGERAPTTFIKTSPCYLIGVKSIEKNGYFSVKLGFKQVKNIKKTQLGELNKAGIKTPLRFFKEFRLDKYKDSVKLEQESGRVGISFDDKKLFVGDEIKPSLFFKPGDIISVSGRSKGKGFQGVVRRHRFAGGPKTHGQSDKHRAPGSIGQTTTPGRVYKGKKMAGRVGHVRVTVRKLEVVDVKEDGLLIKGLVPGSKGTIVEIKN